jgi:hypothetical protein
MKGGLTSGIVYPATVLKLAKNYRFHSVGGTSAGAIAAAVTAAAEAGRFKNGFEKLERVASEIAQPGFLLKIFRAGGATKPLMNLFVSLLARRPKKPGMIRRLWFFGPALYFRLLYFMPLAFCCGAIAGISAFSGVAYLTALIGHFLSEWWENVPHTPLTFASTFWGSMVIAALIGFVIGSVLGPLLRIIRLLSSYLPRSSFFGICTGYMEDDPHILTNWLHTRINELAGRSASDSAITFKDLKDAGVVLKVVSTNLHKIALISFHESPRDSGWCSIRQSLSGSFRRRWCGYLSTVRSPRNIADLGFRQDISI